MLRFRSRRFVFGASVASLLPVSWGSVVGVPAGIWSLVVLAKEEVKAAFDDKLPKEKPDGLNKYAT